MERKRYTPNPNVIKLNLGPTIDREKLAQLTPGQISKDEILQRQLGEEEILTLVDCVTTVIMEGKISTAEVRSRGLDPNLVRTKARCVLGIYSQEHNP